MSTTTYVLSRNKEDILWIPHLICSYVSAHRIIDYYRIYEPRAKARWYMYFAHVHVQDDLNMHILHMFEDVLFFLLNTTKIKHSVTILIRHIFQAKNIAIFLFSP